MEYAQFDLDNLQELKDILVENCSQGEGPMADIDPNNKITLDEAELL